MKEKRVGERKEGKPVTLQWHLPRDTCAVLVKDRKFICDSRSLLLDRFANPRLKGDERAQFWKEFIGKSACSSEERQKSWKEFLFSLCRPEDLLFAKLRSRLMVNMAGGVMENAGLCLDRFGLPYIPGSAVKGCARRAAIRELREAPTDTKAELLETVAIVFGWAKEDWEDSADFAYGCQENWEGIRERVARRFGQKLSIDPPRGKPAWSALPNFAGTVRFLPAYAYQMPNPDLELDVVTPHHQRYYRGDGDYPVAFDCEEPIPVLFPAVAPGALFVFPIQPAPPGMKNFSPKARSWLAEGLEKLGIGAKTTAGYGWFDCSEPIQKEMQEKLAQEREERERAAKRAHLEPDPKQLEELGKLKESDLRGRINRFSEEEQYWTEEDRKDEGMQITLLYYLTDIKRELYDDAKGKPKSKVWKALQNLAKKFGKTLP